MAKELKHIDISNRPDLLQLVQEAQTTSGPLVFRQDNEDVAILRSVKKVRKPRIPRGKAFTKDDPIFNLMGIGRSGLHDVSENADKYLAEAYLDTHTGV